MVGRWSRPAQCGRFAPHMREIARLLFAEFYAVNDHLLDRLQDLGLDAVVDFLVLVLHVLLLALLVDALVLLEAKRVEQGPIARGHGP